MQIRGIWSARSPPLKPPASHPPNVPLVSNSCPLISLARISQLGLLPSLFEDIVLSHRGRPGSHPLGRFWRRVQLDDFPVEPSWSRAQPAVYLLGSDAIPANSASSRKTASWAMENGFSPRRMAAISFRTSAEAAGSWRPEKKRAPRNSAPRPGPPRSPTRLSPRFSPRTSRQGLPPARG